jgi:hypothetical protein
MRGRRSTQVALTAAILIMASVACGGEGAIGTKATRPSVVLTGWTAVDDAPGISQLAPDLGGLRLVERVDHEALVRNGEAIRSSTFTFSTRDDAAQAQKRGAGDDYQRNLERAFRGGTVAHGPGVGLRLRVPRTTGSGSDTVEVYLLTRGANLTVVELLSADGFDPALRKRILSRVSR